jgi:hypothetical protein
MSYEVMAAQAIGYVLSVLGKAGAQVVEGTAKAGAEKLLAYLQAKLGDDTGKKALEDLQAGPTSAAQEVKLKGAIMDKMESDTDFAQELTTILKDIEKANGLSNTQTGDNNKNAQIAGHGNKVSM